MKMCRGDTGDSGNDNPSGADEPTDPSEPVQDASASVSETKSSVNWYEIIKIVLLAALAVNMLWKPRKETTKY